MKLPAPGREGSMSVEKALQERRSVRSFSATPLSLQEVSQLLWAAQGITSADGGRTTPSAGAFYPLEIFLVVGAVQDLAAGVYRYNLRLHEVDEIAAGDMRAALVSAAFDQAWMLDAPAAIVIAAVFERTTRKYRERGKRYVAMEAGHAAQNISLQAVSLGLGTCVVAAFDDLQVREVLQLPAGAEVLNILPVGHPPTH